MKNATILLFLLAPSFLFSQIKQIAETELTVGSGVFFSAEKDASTITVTLKGPFDRYFGVGFGVGMSSGDLIMISNNGVITDVRDHFMVGQTTPATDASQDWTILSNTVLGTQRTIIASRNLNTGGGNDIIFNFSDNTQTLFWAKSASANFAITYHGGANRGSGIIRNWVLDVTGPTIVSTIPADNSSVAVPSNMSITYNEAIFNGTGTITLFNDSDQTSTTFSVPSASVVISGASATINTGALLADKAYHVTISAGTFQDVSANNTLAVSSSTSWNFITNGAGAPTVSSYIPIDNSVGVALTSNLTLNLSEAVNRGAGSISLFKADGTLIQSFVANSSPNVTQPIPNQIVINPTSDLVLNTSYYVNYTATSLVDLTGDQIVAVSNTSTWNFNTSDGVNPLDTSTVPNDNAIGVSLTNDYSITFNEAIFAGTGVVELFDASNNLFDQFDVTNAGQVSISGNTATLNQNFLLLPNTSYYLRIPAGAFSDGVNLYAGISNNTDWNFNTNDVIAPTILTTIPSDNSLTVGQLPNMSITFSENIAAIGTATIDLIGPAGTTTFITGTNATVTGANINFSPAALLPIGNYHLLIATAELEDLAGNDFAGILSDTIWNFTVIDDQAPILSLPSLSPADNSFLSDITNETFTLTFNEPVQWSTGEIRIVKSDSSFVEEYSSTVNSGLVTFTGNTVTFTHSFPFGIADSYAIVISANALEDISGNEFSGILNLSTWNFTINWSGIDENLSGKIIYQNGLITFEKDTNFKLLSLEGKIIKTGNGLSVDLVNLATGSYILQMENQFSKLIYVH